jgi:hypothetical protein
MSSAWADVTPLLDVQVGSTYPPLRASLAVDETPTLQFLVPNSGETARFFPEYEVALLRESGEVVIVSARRVHINISECTDESSSLQKVVAEHFQDLEYSEDSSSFSAKTENIFISIQCVFMPAEAPFPTLEYQQRGKIQDSKLEKAWGAFFGE